MSISHQWWAALGTPASAVGSHQSTVEEICLSGSDVNY